MTQLIEMTSNQMPLQNLNQSHLNLDDSKMMRVLVVEDDLTLKSFWSHILNDMYKKNKIDWASSEEEAETLIRNRFIKGKPYDLVISDIFLAGQKTGIELWLNLAEAAHQFLFVSVLAENRFEQLMRGMGTQPLFLQKPLRASACKEALATMAQNRGNYG